MPGLGKHSPVKLQFNKPNFEALIERHGQYTRWLASKPCPCVDTNSRTDPNCPLCGGSGYRYDQTKGYKTGFRGTVMDGLIAMPAEYLHATVVSIRDRHNKVYPFEQLSPELIAVTAPSANNEVMEVEVSVPLVKHLEGTYRALQVTVNHYVVEDLLTPAPTNEGQYHRMACDIVSVQSLKTTAGEEAPIIGFRRNTITALSSEPELMVTGIDYLEPVVLLILSQELSKEDFNVLQTLQGSAVCTYPYHYGLSQGDILTVLAGCMTGKQVMRHGEVDTIPAHFVEAVAVCETKSRAYVEGIDFVIAGCNQMHWIGAQPEYGEMLALVYTYYPTYQVLQELPMLRTSENQRLPRKCVIKLLSGFMDNRGLQWQSLP